MLTKESRALANYFLPWLTLTAQLPYETGSPWSNILSFVMAVGSPALVTYSLTITIMNRARVRSLFKGLRSKACESEPNDGKDRYKSRIKAVQTLLQEGQQVPLRASQVNGWLTSLLLLQKNDEWWAKLDGRLKDTRRGITASLVAQTLFAGLAYILTVITSFDSELGDPGTALQIASGTLWIWLIPVIWGWIAVGTQHRSDSVENALKADWARVKSCDELGNERNKKAKQKGILVRSGLNPLPLQPKPPTGVANNINTPKSEGSHSETVPSRTASVGTVNGNIINDGGVTSAETQPQLDFQVLEHLQTHGSYGDERRCGPIYNYARIFSWWQLALTMESTLHCAIEGKVDDDRAPDSEEMARVWIRLDGAEKRTPDDIAPAARYCGLRWPVLAYPEWSAVYSDVSPTIWVGSLAALFLQWGTTGASIFIAYQTPTKGLGCRSGSYLLYGTLGTLVWLCLLTSSLLSHEVMLHYQKVQVANRWTDFRTYKKTTSHAFLAAAAVILRRLGKVLAGVNALWLVVSSLFEFIGMFDNCWCSGDALGLGHGGWIMLFKNKDDLRNLAIGQWAGGLAITLIVCTVSCVCFNLGCLETKEKGES